MSWSEREYREKVPHHPKWLALHGPERGVDYVTGLAKNVLEARPHGNIRIVACDSNLPIYSSGILREALKHVATTRDVQIKILVASKNQEEEILQQLAEEGTIQLQKIPGLAIPHFFTVEAEVGWEQYDNMIEEKIHEPGIPSEKIQALNRNWAQDDRYTDSREYWKNRIASNKKVFDEIFS